MKILHITAQKPDSTGSGVYMSGLIQCLDKLGHKQAVITGIDIKDNKNSFKENIRDLEIYNFLVGPIKDEIGISTYIKMLIAEDMKKRKENN